MEQNNFSRRQFLQTGVLAAFTATVLPTTQQEKILKEQQTDTNKILNYNPEMRYRQLGNTGIYFSVISMGGIGLQQSVAHHAIDLGVNFFHIATNYNKGTSIQILGKVLKEKRNKVYLAVKDTFYKGALDDINEVLKILNTDYIDFLMFARHQESEVNDPKIVENFEKWKQQGKVRFAGLTTHKEVKPCVAVGIDSGIYCLIQTVLNQPNLEAMTDELNEAKQKHIGIMAMKTMKGVDDHELQIAYLKKVLKNPAVTTVNKGFPTFDLFNAFYKAMQETLTSEEDFSLYRYAQKNRAHNCMMCGECEKACPHRIEISTILRCKMYYGDQLGDVETAINTLCDISTTRRHYPHCDQCKKCEKVCPNGIPIVDKLNEAYRFFRDFIV